MLSEFSELDYWNYYDPRYPWGRYRSPLKFLERLHREIDASGESFSAAGFSDDAIEELLASGYIVTSGLVIDRYYGGLLTSSDLRSRIAIATFRDEPFYKEHPARVHHAKSLEDVTACIANWQITTGRRLLFRGQTANYPLQRRRANPGYQVPGFGEISLLPSIWRKLHHANPAAREEFVNLSLLEWSKVLYSAYDLKEIEARHAAALERGEWMYSAQDMEDSDDPLLHEFGKLRLDLTMGFEHDLNVPLQTLLQHYGLLSPLLDLTTDLDVALFFASHKFETDPTTELPKIAFVGTNDRKAVLYVLRENVNEMQPGVRRRAELLYQQMDGLLLVRHTVRGELLAESRKHPAVKILRQIPLIGPLRATLLLALMQTPYRFRSKRQLWTYSGLGVETHDSAQHRYVDGQLQRSKKPQQIRGLNQNHNHEMKKLFKSTAMSASRCAGPLQDFYAGLLAKGMKPDMARLTLARKIAAITLTLWKKGERFDAEHLKSQAA